MKITKQRLKEIIKEELSPELVDVAVLAARNNDLDAFKNTVLELLEIGINDPRASQITRISGELMEKVHDADLSHEALGKQLLKLKLIPDLQRMLSRLSENKPTMKLTKQRLKEIIKEEFSHGRSPGQKPIIDPPRKLEYNETCPRGYKLNILDYCELVGSDSMAVEAEITRLKKEETK